MIRLSLNRDFFIENFLLLEGLVLGGYTISGFRCGADWIAIRSDIMKGRGFLMGFLLPFGYYLFQNPKAGENPNSAFKTSWRLI